MIQMTNDLERTMRMNYHYDFYQTLLTDKQQKYIELYYLEDFQFSEIAEEMVVTRQAVYDNFNRCRDLLEHHQENLCMYKNLYKRLELYQQIRTNLGDLSPKTEEIISKLEDLD